MQVNEKAPASNTGAGDEAKGTAHKVGTPYPNTPVFASAPAAAQLAAYTAMLEAEAAAFEQAAVQEAAPAPQPEAQPAPIFHLMTATELEAMPDVEWIVDGLIPARGIGQVFGVSGSGKTFLVLDLARHIAEGESWYGHRTSKTSVVYVGLEGRGTFKQRVTALRMFTEKSIPDNLKFVTPDTFDITNNAYVDALASAVDKGSLIILDTQNQSAPFLDENAAKDMGFVVQGANRLATTTGGVVLLVAHAGKDVTKGV